VCASLTCMSERARTGRRIVRELVTDYKTKRLVISENVPRGSSEHVNELGFLNQSNSQDADVKRR
jgi:hypothetical protein